MLPSRIHNLTSNTSRFYKIFTRAASKDPGIQRRKKLVSLDENESDIQDFEDMESDFMEVHKSHKQHIRELQLAQEKLKYNIVKQKYFKEKFPNFLTWYDKEQVRYLHRTDPEEWTIERLSEGFPALPQTVQKIIKSDWTKNKQSKITNHDESVQENWKLFKSGELGNLPQELVEHLKKFTNRALNLTPFIKPENPKNSFKVKVNTVTEFSDIITSYNKLKSKNFQSDKQIVDRNILNETIDENCKTTQANKSVTLGELQASVNKRIDSGQNIDESEKLIVKVNIKKEDDNVKQDLVDLSENKYQSATGVQYFKKCDKDVTHLNYPQRINIPKSITKKDAVYKLNDCYYDYDGEFLYRVPGMA